MKIIKLIILLIISNAVFGQEKTDGKVRAILIDPVNALSFIENNRQDSCFMYIYKGDQIVKTINISRLLIEDESLEVKLFHDFYLENGTYFAYIENLFILPILITDINVRKGKMSFIPINFNHIVKTKNIRPNIIVWNYQKILIEYMDKKNN